MIEDYLSTIFPYISKYIECKLDHCIPLYSSLVSLNPVPTTHFFAFFSALLSKDKKLTSENLDAIAFLLFKLINDNPDAMQIFLEELSFVRIEKQCLENSVYLILHFME